MKKIMRKFSKSFALMMLLSVVLVGCATEKEEGPTEFTFGEELTFTIENETEINLDLENSDASIKEKYDTLYGALSSVDMSNIAIGSTSTVNMLSEIGFLPKASVESSSLKPEIAEKLVETTEDNEEGIINIGSALTPNIEIIAKNGIEMIIISDALPQTSWEESLTELGIKVQRLNQSEYSDMFVILQVFKDLDILDNSIINEKMLSMKNDLEVVNNLQVNNEENKSIALLQMMGEVTYINGDNSVLGKVTKGLSTENVFASSESSEINVEEMLIKNPEYLIVYGAGLTQEALVQTFENQFTASESALSDLQAVQNEQYIFLGDDSFEFMGSIDFNVTKVMRQIVEGIYGE